MEKYYISLSKYEEINIAGGLKNVWELLGFLFQCEYNGFEANNFAPSVMPYLSSTYKCNFLGADNKQ